MAAGRGKLCPGISASHLSLSARGWPGTESAGRSAALQDTAIPAQPWRRQAAHGAAERSKWRQDGRQHRYHRRPLNNDCAILSSVLGRDKITP